MTRHSLAMFHAVENGEVIGRYEGPAGRAYNYARRANPNARIELAEVIMECPDEVRP